MATEILRLQGIRKSFSSRSQTADVLRGIDLSVSAGEFITLLGSSGCGKTTTLRIIAGLEDPDAGRVFLEGRDITLLPPEKRDVNTIFQNYALFPNMTVADNVGYALRLRRRPRDEIRRRVTEMLDLIQLPGYGDRLPAELSGGQRQRVAIARAVINEPRVLLLDEPLGALDLKLRRQMQLELKRLQQKLGITFIYITHDQEEAINMSDRIAVMHDGGFEQIGTPNEIYYRPRTSYVANFVGNANLYRAGGKTYAIRPESLLFAPAGSPLPPDGAGPAAALPATVLERSFAGGQLRILFALADGQQLTAARSGLDAPLTVGEAAAVGWAAPRQIEVTDNGV